MTYLDKLETASTEEAVSLLSNRFAKNKQFFQKNLPNLAPFLELKTKDYELNISNNGINIKDIHNNKLLFPIIDNKSSIFLASKDLSSNPTTNPIWHGFANDNVMQEDIGDNRVPITGKIVDNIVKTVKSDKDYKENKIHFNEDKQLPATLFLGISAGLHIEYIINEYEILHSVLIYEPNVDFFILSCYFIDYEKLYEKTNEFSCFIIVKGFINSEAVKDFIGSRLITNSFIRFEHYAYRDKYIEDAIKISGEASKTSVRGWGTYEDEIIGLENKLSWLDPKEPKYPFLYCQKDIQAPIVVVGNGPSLNFLIPFLQENQEKLIIFSSGTALAPLKRNGIKPDFQIEIERMDHVKAWLDDAGLDEIPLISADIVHQTTLSCSKETYMFIRTATTAQDLYKPKFVLDHANPLVGNASFALALNFSKEVYLCGLDMGFKKDEKQHATGSKYDDMNDKSIEEIPTRGNLSKNIYTNSLFSLSKVSIEQAINCCDDCTVYNLSDGAFINGTISKEFDKVKLKKIDKNSAIKNIKESFTKKDFFNSDSNNYKNELIQYKKDLLTILYMPKMKDKTLLFKTIDYAFYATTIQRRSNPVTGTLLSGSLWHILNTIFIMLSHIDRDDVDKLYKKIIKNLEKDLDGFCLL